MIEPYMDDLYRDGEVYDLLYPPDDPSPIVAFLSAQAGPYGSTILELAAGTGTLAIPLAQTGFTVTGLERSSSMLAKGRRKADAADVKIEWVQGDMRDFSIPRQFDTVILAGNALAHLLTNQDLRACMTCVHRHLRPGGAFVLIAFHPNLQILTNPPDHRGPFGRYQAVDGSGEVVVTTSSVYAADTQIAHVTTHTRYPGREEEVQGDLKLRMVFPQELDALLENNGFEIIAKYGNFEMEPFGGQAESQIIIGQK